MLDRTGQIMSAAPSESSVGAVVGVAMAWGKCAMMAVVIVLTWGLAVACGGGPDPAAGNRIREPSEPVIFGRWRILGPYEGFVSSQREDFRWGVRVTGTVSGLAGDLLVACIDGKSGRWVRVDLVSYQGQDWGTGSDRGNERVTFYVTGTGKTGASVGNVFVVAEPELKGVRIEGGGAEAMAMAMLAGGGRVEFDVRGGRYGWSLDGFSRGFARGADRCGL